MRTTAVLLLFAATCLLPFSWAEEDTAKMVQRNNEMLAKYSRSIVQVEYFFKMDKQAEVPGIQVSYLCPHCKSYHQKELDSLISSRQSQGVPGFVVAPNRILSVDMQLRLDWLERIEVITDGQRLPAQITRYFPSSKAIELQVTGLSKTPLTPITFTEQPQGKYSYFFLVKENGIRIAGCRPDNSENIRKNLDSGVDFRITLPNTIVIDSQGEAVSLSFQEHLPITHQRFASPQHWTGITAAEREKQLADFQSGIANALYPVSFLLSKEENTKTRGYSRYQDKDKETEFFAVGMLLTDGRLLCNLLLTDVQTARLEKILLHLPDGKTQEASFVGSLKDWGGIMIATTEKLPAPGLTLQLKDLSQFCDQPALSVFAQNFGSKLKLHIVPTLLAEFTLGYENLVIPAPQNYDAQKCLLLDMSGQVLLCSFEQRGKLEKYGTEITPLPGKYIAGLLAANEPFDPNNVPKSRGEETRYAWLGADMQELTPELARANNVSVHTKDGKIGVLLNNIIAQSPAAKAGMKTGDILLYLRTADGDNRTDLNSEYCAETDYYRSNFPWDQYDQMPERYFSEIPTPWASVVNDFTRLLSKIGIGKTAIFGLLRKGEQSEKSIILEESPPYFEVAPRYTAKDFGLTVAEMTYEVRDYFRLDQQAPGLVITAIIPGSTASVSGLKPYEIILSVDNQPVHNVKEFEKSILYKQTLSLQVRRLTTNRIVKIQAKTAAATPSAAQ